MKTILILLVVFLCTLSSNAQLVILEPIDDLPPCTSINLGQVVNFQRGVDCIADVVLLDIEGNEVFRSSDLSFSYTFDAPGEFTFYCGAGPVAIAMAALCVQVSIVPTLSEWGLICLGLILGIVSITAIKTNSLFETREVPSILG